MINIKVQITEWAEVVRGCKLAYQTEQTIEILWYREINLILKYMLTPWFNKRTFFEKKM